MHRTQVEDSFGRWWLSALVATLPILVRFGLLVGVQVKPHGCAIGWCLYNVAGCEFCKWP